MMVVDGTGAGGESFGAMAEGGGPLAAQLRREGGGGREAEKEAG